MPDKFEGYRFVPIKEHMQNMRRVLEQVQEDRERDMKYRALRQENHFIGAFLLTEADEQFLKGCGIRP